MSSNPAIIRVKVKEQREEILQMVDRPRIDVMCKKCGSKEAYYSHIRNVSGTMYSVFYCATVGCYEEFLRPRGVIY